MARVTYENLFSESRNNVVTLISNVSNVPDPVSSAAEVRKRIYSREPDLKASNFAGFPFIIINPADVDIEEGGSLDMKSKFVAWDIEIEIVASDRGYGEEDGKGLSHIDTITNNVMKTLLNKTNRLTLSSNALKFLRPITTGVTTETMADTLIYRRSIMLSFRSRIQVSA